MSIDEVKKEDILIAKPGNRFAVDGIIVKGSTHVDESFISGESIPVKKSIDDKVVAGAINLDGEVLYKAENIGKDSTISEIVRLVVEATNTKAPIARIADKVSGVFVPIVITLAVITFIIHLILGFTFSESIVYFVTVLVCACPCALGLATPLAIVISEGLCAKNGILVKKSEILENANKIDVIVHLAAMAGVRPSIENPLLYQEVNGIGTQNILEEAKLHNVKSLVMASSSSVYGNCKEVPFKEDMIVDYAISPYAATKKANEVMAHVYHKLNDMNIIMLRFFTVYGPKQRPDLAINKFTRLMLEGKRIPMYGDGTTSRDYTYVDDIVDGICKSCDYVINNDNVYEIINLGSNSPVSLKEMINTIGEVLNVEPKIEVLPMQPGDVDRTYADISKAKKLLGYSPKFTFKEGIQKFIDWYKDN